jgi:hypothetical protein
MLARMPGIMSCLRGGEKRRKEEKRGHSDFSRR